MKKAILAVAGGRKTQRIVDKCSSNPPQKSRLVITYTLTGQAELSRRLREACQPGFVPEVMGWYTFLLHHLIRPYLQSLYPGQELNGLHFDDVEPRKKLKTSGAARYFDSEGRAYKMRLSKLALDVVNASKGSAINRLERIFAEIYIDEIQDLIGNDLNILETLLESKISVTMVGDVRQTVLSTNPTDMKNARFRGLSMIDWFRILHADGMCTLEEQSTTWRSNQIIASFADSVLPTNLGFPPTHSEQSETTDHDGVFVVSWGDLPSYLNTFKPSCFRYNKNSTILDTHVAINFGQCKGLTCLRVLIYPTNPILQFLEKAVPLEGKSAAGLYVAITRAVHSVAFVVKDPGRYAHRVPQWTPH